MAMARRVARGDDIREVCKDVVRVELAVDEHDGTKDAWLESEEEACEEAGVTPEAAYGEWHRGYMDVAAALLEAEVENSLWDMLDSDTTPETPRSRKKNAAKGKKKKAKANPLTSRAQSYDDFFRDGMKDAIGAWDPDAAEDEIEAAVRKYKRTPTQITAIASEAVEAYWKTVAEESREDWLSQNAEDVEENLDADQAYQSWSDGWKMQAKRLAADEIAKRADR